MSDLTPYKNADGEYLTQEELSKLLRQNGHPQLQWWKAKVQPRTGASKPPRGVRQNKHIKDL